MGGTLYQALMRSTVNGKKLNYSHLINLWWLYMYINKIKYMYMHVQITITWIVQCVHVTNNYNFKYKDPLRRGHNRNNLSIKDTLQCPKCSFSHIVNTFWTSEEQTPLYKGQNGWPQHVLYPDVPLYSCVHVNHTCTCTRLLNMYMDDYMYMYLNTW